MDERLYFVLGDLLANVAGAALVGWLVWLITPLGWNMLMVMFGAMLVGMILATLIWFPFSVWFGAMEVMVPLMLSGMLAGMVVGMRATMHPMTGANALFVGAVCGLVSIVAVWVLNNSLRGPQALRREVAGHD